MTQFTKGAWYVLAALGLALVATASHFALALTNGTQNTTMNNSTVTSTGSSTVVDGVTTIFVVVLPSRDVRAATSSEMAIMRDWLEQGTLPIVETFGTSMTAKPMAAGTVMSTGASTGSGTTAGSATGSGTTGGSGSGSTTY